MSQISTIGNHRTVEFTNNRGDCTVSWGRLLRQQGITATASWGRLLRHRGITATAGAAALVAIAGGTFAVVSSPRTSHEELASAGDSKPVTQAK
jgi:hypothetical protein